MEIILEMIECKHENLHPDIYNFFSCPTPYCSGGEYFCLDCRRYIVECGCQYNNDVSGWSMKRWRKYWEKRLRLIAKPSA